MFVGRVARASSVMPSPARSLLSCGHFVLRYRERGNMRPKALLPAVLVALDRRARLRADDRGQRDDAQEQPLYRRAVLARPLGRATGRARSSASTGTSAKITTQSVAGMVDYGVTDRLNVIATLPYVWTEASQGVLHGVSGWQDLTVAAKFNLLETRLHAQRVAAHDRRRRRGRAHRRLHAGPTIRSRSGSASKPPLGTPDLELPAPSGAGSSTAPPRTRGATT